MVETHFSSDSYSAIAILALHHKHMKLVKLFIPHVIAWSVTKSFWSVGF